MNRRPRAAACLAALALALAGCAGSDDLPDELPEVPTEEIPTEPPNVPDE